MNPNGVEAKDRLYTMDVPDNSSIGFKSKSKQSRPADETGREEWCVEGTPEGLGKQPGFYEPWQNGQGSTSRAWEEWDQTIPRKSSKVASKRHGRIRRAEHNLHRHGEGHFASALSNHGSASFWAAFFGTGFHWHSTMQPASSVSVRYHGP